MVADFELYYCGIMIAGTERLGRDAKGGARPAMPGITFGLCRLHRSCYEQTSF